MISLGVKAYTQPEEVLTVGSFSFATTIILVFWLALWQGIETSLEPTLFSELGFLGVATFVRQVTQTSSKHITWPSIRSIDTALTRDDFNVISVFATASIFAFAGAFNATVAGAFAGAFNATVAVPIAVVAAVAIVVAASAAFFAIKTWYKLRPELQNGYLKVLAIFAFPWFCWLPIVSVLSTWALYDLLTQVSPISSVPIWPQTALGVAIVAGVWAALWHRGQWLDSRTRNPFHGGALGAALGVKRSELKKSLPT